MVQFNNDTNKVSCVKKSIGMWSHNYFPSKVLCFFVIPGDETTYAIIHSCNVNDHESDSILFERWELGNTSGPVKNGKQCIMEHLHVVDVDCFGDPILVIED